VFVGRTVEEELVGVAVGVREEVGSIQKSDRLSSALPPSQPGMASVLFR